MPVTRLQIWSGAVVLAGVAWLFGSRLPNLQNAGPILGLATLGGLGLGAEVLLLLREMAHPRSSPPPRDTRPPDGRFELRTLAGVEATANRRDARFSRFERFGTEPGLDAAAEGRVASAALGGRVLIVSLFVGRYGQAWEDEEIAAACRALGRVAEWVEREAARWNARVNVDLCDTYFAADDPEDPDVVVQFLPEGDHQGPFEAQADAKTIASASRAALALGFADIEALMRAVHRRADADWVVWMVHPRAAGRSLAIPVPDSPVPGVALAVCYAREASFPEPIAQPPFPDPTTYAHEMLHLFGASDKYKKPLSAFAPGLVSDRDIMALYQRSLPRLRVDRLTASEIGWEAG